MDITAVRIMPVEGNTKLKAYVTLELDGRFAVKDLKVIRGRDRYFVAMPAKRLRDGTYLDLFHPLDKAARDELECRVLKEYEEVAGADHGAGAAGDDEAVGPDVKSGDRFEDEVPGIVAP